MLLPTEEAYQKFFGEAYGMFEDDLRSIAGQLSEAMGKLLRDYYLEDRREQRYNTVKTLVQGYFTACLLCTLEFQDEVEEINLQVILQMNTEKLQGRKATGTIEHRE